PAIGDSSINACDYNPTNPENDDAHGREFGGVYSDTQRTVEAARAIYAELARRSILREGIDYPLPLSTTLIVDGSETTVDGAITHFVTGWDYDSPADRRQYVFNLITAIQGLDRTTIERIYMPLVFKGN
ncbi:MAG: hypothetical protein JXA42_08450, partial [Anaerolineales bacterium]|nr:hypothetical protein [Anaerolineales bacterium]